MPSKFTQPRKPHFQMLKGGGVKSPKFKVKVSLDSPCGRGVIPGSSEYDEEETWETNNLSFDESALDFVEELIDLHPDYYDTLTEECGMLLDIEASTGDVESIWVYFDQPSQTFKTEGENPGRQREKELRDYSLMMSESYDPDYDFSGYEEEADKQFSRKAYTPVDDSEDFDWEEENDDLSQENEFNSTVDQHYDFDKYEKDHIKVKPSPLLDPEDEFNTLVSQEEERLSQDRDRW